MQHRATRWLCSIPIVVYGERRISEVEMCSVSATGAQLRAITLLLARADPTLYAAEDGDGNQVCMATDPNVGDAGEISPI